MLREISEDLDHKKEHKVNKVTVLENKNIEHIESNAFFHHGIFKFQWMLVLGRLLFLCRMLVPFIKHSLGTVSPVEYFNIKEYMVEFSNH